ncbi:group II intron maturase-specific domain-containing protein [Kitasatospora sp. NPDC001159]
MKAKIRALTHKTSQQDFASVLVRLAQIMRGWANYFRHAVAKWTFSKLDGALAVCYPAPIHDHGPDEPCSYDSEDPAVRRPDEEAMEKLRRAWERHGFSLLAEGVYACRMEP